VRQWLQERAQDIQSRSELYLQVQGTPPPNVVNIINQAIQEAVRASQPPTNHNNNNNNNNNNTPGTSSPLVTSVEWLDGPHNPMDKTIKVGFDGVAKKGSQFDHITLTDWSGENQRVPAEFDGEGGEQGQYLTVYPPYYLNYGTHYTLKIPAGAVAKLSGNGVNEEKVYSFTTGEWQMSDGPWTMLGHDPQRSGQSQYSGPDCPTIKWEDYLGLDVFGTPLVGSDGFIYMADDEGVLSVAEEVYEEGYYYLNVVPSFSGGGDCYATPAMGKDGTVYYCAGDKLFAFKYEDNVLESLWSLDAGDDVSECSPAIGPDGTIYIVAQIDNENEYGGYLLAVDPDGTESDERLKWSICLGQGEVFSPAVGPDGTIYVAMAAENEMMGRLFAVNPDGSPRWDYDADGNMDSVTLEYDDYDNTPVAGPVVGPDGTVYVAMYVYEGQNTVGRLFAVKPDGTSRWQDSESVSLGNVGDGSIYPPTVGPDGTAYVSVYKCGRYPSEEPTDGRIVRISPDGVAQVIAQREDTAFSTPAIGSDGTVYVAYSYHLLAMDSQGEEKWSIGTSYNSGIQPVIGADGTIYLGAWGEVFSMTAIVNDSSDLELVSTEPSDGAINYAETYIKLEYSKLIKAGPNISGITLTYYDDEDEVEQPIFWGFDGKFLYINALLEPDVSSHLESDTEYTLTIPPGAVTDLVGEQFDGCTITFITIGF
jgi:hypothetical protein